ncbi:MAG TPA: hypothetical protein HA341_06510 [Halobacteria archaeon]|jgi:CO dehydrogenase/acetyl-CoA synthase beta subunit|nr:hypothetical protein [Halobacteria archaeon]
MAKKLKLSLKTPGEAKKTETPSGAAPAAAAQQPAAAPIAPMGGFGMTSMPQISFAAPQPAAAEGGIKLILKNAKIEIGQIILKSKKDEKEEE